MVVASSFLGEIPVNTAFFSHVFFQLLQTSGNG